MELKNYLFRIVNKRGEVTNETIFYDISNEMMQGILCGLTLGAKRKGTKTMPYAVAYAFNDNGVITDCEGVNTTPNGYYHPTQINKR